MSVEVSVEVAAPTASAMRAIGERLARVLQAGDLVVLTGALGAGKTTLAQGIGAGLDVRGAVTSPTFVISRVHPPLGGGPALVHVDAYRLGGRLEVDDLDLDASLDDAVTLVEWGEGLVEALSEDRLEVEIARAEGDDLREPDVANQPDGARPDDGRHVRVAGYGRRWSGVDLSIIAR